MTLSNEELLLTLIAKENATDVFGKVDQSARSMSSNVCSVISSMSKSMMSFGEVTDNLMQSFTGKSALDNILGTSSKADTNKVLIKNMTETEEAYESLYNTIDKTTDSSLTSMQELIPAMNAFKASTGASDKAMESITDDMANFGAAVLAQTGSTDLAQGAMMDLSKGIKGAFASLDQYGVSEDALMRTKLWSGKEDDVEGYMAAVTKVIGSTEELMETNQGLDALIGKAFSRAGKKMGNDFLPIIKDVKRGFLDLDNELGGNLTASILALSAGLDVANNAFWNFSTMVRGARDAKDVILKLNDALRGTKEAAEMANNAMDMGSNISQIGADVSGATSGAGVVGDIALSGGLDVADSIKDTSKQKKEAKKLFEERGKLLAELHNFDGSKDSKEFKKIQKKLSKVDVKLDKDFDGVNPVDLIKNKSKKELAPDEVSNLFKLNEGTLKELEKEDWGLTDAIKNNIRNQRSKVSKAMDSLKSFVNEGFGTKLQNGLKSASGIPMKIKESFGSFGNKLGDIKSDGISGNFKKIDKSVYKFIKGADETEDVLKKASDVGDEVTDAAKNLKNTKNIADATEGMVEGAAAVGAAAPEAAAAGAGVEATAAATTTLTGAFTSMIVPLLAAAAVIAIMIPIATGLIIEAMLFLNVIQQVFAAMDFGSVDLKDNINGIKKLAEGLAWVGVAMGAMTFTSIMTGLAVMTGGFLGITGPLQIAIDALTEAAGLLKNFGTVGIDPSVPNNLKNISDSLMSVSKAMGALAWTNITTGFSNWISGALGFDSATDALGQAKDDLIKASTEINTLAGEITPIDEDKAKNIQNVCDSLASVGDAIGALRSIRDGQNWDNLFGDLMEGLFGKGVDIKTALDNVKTDIKDAADALKEWDLPDIDEKGKLGEKIKKVSDTLTSVNDAFQTLRGLRDDNNWDEWIGGIFEGSDIKTAIGDVVTDINEAASALSGLSLDSFGEDSTIGDNIKNVADALTSVNEAATTLTNLPPMENFDSSQITTAVTNLQTAATELSNLNETTFDSESVNSVLTNVQTALENLKTTLSSASGFTETSIGIGAQIVSGVQTGLNPLGPAVQGAVSSALSSASEQATTGGNTLGENATDGMKSTLQLKSTMETEVGYALDAITSKTPEFYDAGAALGQAAKDGFESNSAINPGSPGNLAHTMMDEVGYILEAMKSKYSTAYNMAAGLGLSIYQGFGNLSLNMDMFTKGGQLTTEHIGALNTTISKAPEKMDNRPVTIIISEGAVSVDARNKTEKEARGIMTLALESLDNITNIDVDV